MAVAGKIDGSMALEKNVLLFLESRKNANKLVDIINAPKDNPSVDIKVWMTSVEKVFLNVADRGDFQLDDTLQSTNKKAYIAEEQYNKWLTEMFETTWMKILDLLDSDDDETKTQALNIAMNLTSSNAKHMCDKFPLGKLLKIVDKVLNGKPSLQQAYVPFLTYNDVSFYTWKALFELSKATKTSDTITTNLLNFVELMTIPDDSNNSLYFYNDANQFKFKSELAKKWMRKVWLSLTNRNLSAANHKKLLIILVERYLDKIHKPTLLVDFLIGSISLRGATALLALQGMATLVTKHNLECPNIFGKLYYMFEPEILHSQFKDRLFNLADIFLRSTYVPEALVAAFAKRLSRLSLVAQTPDLVLIMQFVGNLLIRHPALQILIHAKNLETVDSDPYLMDEPDPMKSKALESSLWELSLLKNHVQPKVSAAAKFLDANMPSIEWEIRENLQSSYSQLFESEIKKNAKIQPATTFVRPVTIAQLRDDRLYKMWKLE